MAKEIGGMRNPMDEGTQVGQIKTSMCDKNVGKKNTPGTHDYSATMNLKAGGGKGNQIAGPGVKGAYPNKGGGKGY